MPLNTHFYEKGHLFYDDWELTADYRALKGRELDLS